MASSTVNGSAARPVMADVARLAGVSQQTVSRVLNDHPNVREQTRAEVLAAIRELGYRPNAAAAHAGHRAHPHARRDQL